MMRDAHRIIQEYLTKTGTVLYALISDNVYWGVVPSGVVGACICFNRSGGKAVVPSVDSFDGVYEFKCYGATDSYTDARTVARALTALLNGVGYTGTIGNIVFAHQETDFDGTDPDTGEPVVHVRFKILTE